MSDIIVLSKFEQELATKTEPIDTMKMEAFAKAAKNIARELGLYEDGMNAWLSEQLARLKTTELLLPYAPELGNNRFRSTAESTKVSWGKKKADLDPNAEIQMTYDEWARRMYEYSLGEGRIRDEWDGWIASGIWATRPILWKIARNKDIEREREELAEIGKSAAPSERWRVHLGDIQTWQAPRQYDFIITDAPYPKEYLPLYEVLARRSVEWLNPGGMLISMCGQSYLDEIVAATSKHLEYYWTSAYLTPGQPTPLRQVKVNTTWKPLLMFVKGEYKGKIFGDVFKSDGNEKDLWGQSVSGMYDIVSKICLPGQSILDPFCGAGTTGIAALKHGCLFDGLDIDEQNVNISKARLNDENI